MPRIHEINTDHPEPSIIQEAAAAIRRGAMVVLPTRGLYGLGCDAFNAEAVQRIFAVKNRPRQNPLLVLISRRDMLDRVVSEVPPLAACLMDAFWPGGITLVMAARKGLPRGLCSKAGKVGVRMVSHPVAARLVDAVGRPITGTSANLSGKGGCADAAELDGSVADAVDIILDAGPLKGGPGSTVVDVTGRTPHVLREGAVPAPDIMRTFSLFGDTY